MTEKRRPEMEEEFTPAEIGAIAHLYRGEIYRSTIWRTRLDTTTNWSVVTLGIALSISFASPDASPIPLILVGFLIMLFLGLEARRYRYFNVWRARSRWMERNFYAPMLRDSGDLHTEKDWQTVLAEDYLRPDYHVSFLTAVARRIRHNYVWILLIQMIAYIGKLMVHPTGVTTFVEFESRAAIGPIPGRIVLLAGVGYCLGMAGLALWIRRSDATRARERGNTGRAIG